MKRAVPDIATEVVRWQAVHGRNHLPWQQTRDPYRVWLSEIMLQQTQVSTVLDYYTRFLERFPDVRALAAAPEDDVMALWSGLGYYSRARNLHRCAKDVVDRHGGAFPRSAEALAGLPGIGRSTAGAIASFCFAERVPILDANVRRVLTRVLGFDADLAVARNERDLWDRASELLPHDDLQEAMPRYTQGLMDLGASLCTPRKPACILCPLQPQCAAAAAGNPEDYPVRTRKLLRRAQAWWFPLLHDGEGRLWLQRRPSEGIWAGLHCPPMFDSREDAMDWLAQRGVVRTPRELDAVFHVLTHRDLHLHPMLVHGPEPAARGQSDTAQEGGWYTAPQWKALGLPAPVRKLLEQLQLPAAGAVQA
ncbi:A/G-specific adenine glycosylase [Paracidovorax cattleyae]|uniref:A/G-specific adenine glycosylase n=1 Tax=Paracidovorax cattleyae TaxID=80868 RepID=UPI000D169DC2|nr:A/G-specific adenine glycosylase [Paracidovorax cattleyae]AVS75271.1 A/G-specific adenine glycosylase [Paracidovorax cattleyae]MBF9264602.1 A/G-specific adenine glycosylase [Paracidovorax cattleyae]